MSLRFKLAAITSAALLAAGLGVALAAPASAVNNQFMCVDATNGNNPQCASPSARMSGATIQMTQAAGTTWNAPPVRGQISIVGGGTNGQQLCMQVDYGHTIGGNGNPIILASCSGRAAEVWIAEAFDGRTYYINEANLNECLNDHAQLHRANAAPCNATKPNFNELWFN